MKKLFIWVSTYNLFFILATVVGGRDPEIKAPCQQLLFTQSLT